MKRIFWILVFLFSVTVAGQAQHMFDYSDIKAGKFQQKSVSGFRSMNDGEHYTITKSGRIEKYTYKTGEQTGVVFDVSKHSEIDSFNDYQFSPDEKKILIFTNRKSIYRRSYTADSWIYDIQAGKLSRLTDEGAEQCTVFSPDGSKIGFVRENNIFFAEISGITDNFPIKQVTHDGERNKIINGHTDWVYEEEFGFTRAFDFSPDGKQIAWIRFDETEVPEFTINRFTDGLYPSTLTYKYPKAGEKNSIVEVWVADLQNDNKTKVDTGKETDQYIPRIGWTPDGKVFCYRTNRLQNHFEVLLADASGTTKVIYDEKDRRYVERTDENTITFLPKGDKFIVRNETSGFAHLYIYSIDKGVTDTLTQGNWEVTNLVGVTSDRVYYMSNEGSVLRNNFYSVKHNGKGKSLLTDGKGIWSVSPSKDFRYFLSYFSNASTPNIVRLHNSSGKVLRTLEDNAGLKKTIADKKLVQREFFRFTAESGATLNCFIKKPVDFDPSKKYPIMMTQYSGPGSQQVLDRWAIDWTDVLVQEGYIVVCVDGRGTGGRGTEFRKVTYGSLGGPETEDQISAAKHLASQPYVDKSRIGIYGWSYGGFMALNCILKGSDVFKLAISVAPVTSWRYYDTVYTELYNGIPQDNPRGYDNNSPLHFAANLKGKLLLIHGTEDDNVHFQNSMAMAQELIKADKNFDMMAYPDDNHGMSPNGRTHIMEKMIEYTLENL